MGYEIRRLQFIPAAVTEALVKVTVLVNKNLSRHSITNSCIYTQDLVAEQ
jgi:branched-subunit amino acid transport protein